MNRLQEYLKTPNPFNLDGYTFQRFQQDNTPNLFQENEGQLTQETDELNIQKYKKSPIDVLKSKKSPIVKLSHPQQPKIIQEVLIFDNMSQQSMQTPINKLSKKQLLRTTAQKKYDLRTTGTIISQNNDNKQSQRSLRVLTSEAYNVVCRKGPLTYKLVSQEIINDTCDLLSSKEQNNIKRRVYDALNVLIALGKLEKKGRRILLSKNYQLQKQHMQKIREFEKQIYEKQKNIVTKRKYYTNECRKISNLKKLIEKNKNRGLMYPYNEKIQIPFIIIKCQGIKSINEKTDNFIKIQIENNETNCIMSDLEVLKTIKLHKNQ